MVKNLKEMQIFKNSYCVHYKNLAYLFLFFSEEIHYLSKNGKIEPC